MASFRTLLWSLSAYVAVDAVKVWPAPGSYHLVDPVFTPYTPNGSVNLAMVPAYARLSERNGVDVVLLGGSTGEWPSLTADERLDLLSAWRAALNGIPASRRPQLIFHAGDVNIPAAQHLASESKARGADAILIVAPCIMRPGSIEDLVSSIQAVAEKAPDLPAVYYHYPELYGVSFPMDQFSELAAKEIPTFAGVKFIDSNIEMLIKATGVANGTLSFFNNEPLLAGLAAGSKGAIGYTTMFPLIRRMQEAFAAGDLVKAQEIQRNIFAYNSLVSKYGGKAAARALPELFDAEVRLGAPRAPLRGLEESEYPNFRKDLISGGFLKPSPLTV